MEGPTVVHSLGPTRALILAFVGMLYFLYNGCRVMIAVVQCEQTKRSGVVRDLPRVGVTDDGELQVVRDEAGDVHIYAKSIDDVLVHRKKDDPGKVA